ncbi:hypothetical protein CMUST_14075 [Corynebacterium mustelae]|uniref:Uncharacterized protein n=1 Tax=Corynebacterium mustelae TaxID=571915 RepID=A0A0G3H5M3_9CORY|nr:hypothetical protein CMUST_14075 [Corynebacterium mustelae]
MKGAYELRTLVAIVVNWKDCLLARAYTSGECNVQRGYQRAGG